MKRILILTAILASASGFAMAKAIPPTADNPLSLKADELKWVHAINNVRASGCNVGSLESGVLNDFLPASWRKPSAMGKAVGTLFEKGVLEVKCLYPYHQRPPH